MSARRSPALTDNLLVAGGTLLSRVTGLARVIVLGWAVVPVVAGTGDARLADAYNLANTTPNIIYELLLGGVISATLVPVFTRAFAHDDHEAVDVVTGTVLAVLAALTAVATLAAPLIVAAYTVLERGGGEGYRPVATSLAFWFLPQIFFYGATSVLTALLNARRRFFAAAWAPVLANLLVIVALVAARTANQGVLSLDDARSSTGLRWLLGIGTTGGIAAMVLPLLPALRTAGIRVRPRVDLHHPAVREVVRLGGWTVGYVVANQVAFAVVTVLAQREPNALSTYLTMFIFQQLPHGLLAVTLMTTFTPDLSRAIVDDDVRAYRITLRQGLRAVLVLLTPAAIALYVLAAPATRLSGRWADLPHAPAVLRGFAFGLVGFSAYLFVLRGFQAMKDTRTPFWINLGENAVNVVLAIAFVPRWGVVGLAYAFSIAYLVSALAAWLVLDRRFRHALRSELLVPVITRVAVAAAAMVVASWAARDLAGADTGLGALVRLAFAGTLGLAVYVAVLVGLGGADPRNPSTPWGRRRRAG